MTFINPEIEITEGEAIGQRMRLNTFLTINEIRRESEEADAIRTALMSSTGIYTAGGGAAPVWSIRYVLSTAEAESKRRMHLRQGILDL